MHEFAPVSSSSSRTCTPTTAAEALASFDKGVIRPHMTHQFKEHLFEIPGPKTDLDDSEARRIGRM